MHDGLGAFEAWRERERGDAWMRKVCLMDWEVLQRIETWIALVWKEVF
jgi:hypothetical protein